MTLDNSQTEEQMYYVYAKDICQLGVKYSTCVFLVGITKAGTHFSYHM